MIEPTHGIKNQNGDWMVDQQGLAVCGPERQMLATAEQMNRDADKYETGASFECVELPSGIVSCVASGVEKSSETPFETEEQWLERIKPQTDVILEAIKDAKANGVRPTCVLMNPADLRSLERNKELPDRIWGYPLLGHIGRPFRGNTNPMKPTPTERDNLVKALVAARVAAKVSCERIGVRAGVTKMAVWMAEQRHSEFSVEMLKAYADLCQLDRDELLVSWGHMPEDAFLKVKQNPKQLLALLRAS